MTTSERLAKLTGRAPLIASVKRTTLASKKVGSTVVPSGLQNKQTVLKSKQPDSTKLNSKIKEKTVL